MSSYLVDVVIEDDQDEEGNKAYHAFCPALRGCHTHGNTYEEALSNIGEAVVVYLESLVLHGDPIPFAPINPERTSVPVGKAPAVFVNVA